MPLALRHYHSHRPCDEHVGFHPTPKSARTWDARSAPTSTSLPMELRRDEAYLPQDVAAMSASAKVCAATV